MNLLDQGCTCNKCLEITKENLKEARDKWNKGEREIVFQDYHYQCGDGCCDEYGTRVYVNGFDLNCDGENDESLVKSLMGFLEIHGVSVEYRRI